MRTGQLVPRSRRRLIAAAFHEAGHAVAAYHVKVRFRRIAIGKNTAKELMSAYLRWMQLRVRALVESPTWRRPIEALAACLVQRRELGARAASFGEPSR